MAVFTTVARDALQRWLAAYDLGELLEFEGIPAGIENTNYFVTTAPAAEGAALYDQDVEKQAKQLGLPGW